MLAYKYRKLIYFSFILFFFFALIGALSAHYDASLCKRNFDVILMVNKT